MRIPAPGEAHRSEIRAVAPPWHRGGCDHNQVSRERAVTQGCTCAPSKRGGGRNQTKAARKSDAAVRMDGQSGSFGADGAQSASYSSRLLLRPPSLPPFLSLVAWLSCHNWESHDAFQVLPSSGPFFQSGGGRQQRDSALGRRQHWIITCLWKI